MSDPREFLNLLINTRPARSGRSSEGKLKAFAWARVSTGMQDERGLSMPEQLREIHRYAKAHDIEIVDVFQEAASAYRNQDRRHEFRRMLERAVVDQTISRIIVHDLSRFGRDSSTAKSDIQALRRGLPQRTL